MDFLTLDSKGAALSLVLGAAFFMLGFDLGFYFVLVMILFLVLSAAVTAAGIRYKKKIGTYQTHRGIKNVIANGAAPLIMALIYSISSIYNSNIFAMLSVIGFTASVAAITADKFASELGVFGGIPKMIFTFKKVKKGVSGGITALGLLASLAASFIMALLILFVSYKLHSISPASLLYAYSARDAVISIAIAGFIGGIVDSMLGFFEEKGIGSKYSSNFLCSIAGAIAAILIFIAL